MATFLSDLALGDIPSIAGLGVTPYYDGFVYGDLDTEASALTYTQRETIRKYNWRLLRLKHDLAKKRGNDVLFAKAGVQRLEVHAPSGDTLLTVEQNKTLTIKGQGKSSTTLAFYPFALFKTSRQWITTETLTTLNITDVTVTGITKFGFETYQGATTASGSVIDISSVYVYEATGSSPRSDWLDNIDGKDIYIRVTDTMASNGRDGGYVKTQNRVVVSHTSTTLTLDTPLTSQTTAGVTYPLSDYLNVDLTIALPFEQSISLSDFNTYKQTYDDSRYLSTFIRHEPNSGNNEVSTINFNGTHMSFFKNGVQRNNGACTFNVDDSDITDCYETGFSFFSGDYELDAFVNFNQNGGTLSTVKRCGTALAGVSERVYVTAGLVLGSGAYISPNVRTTAQNVLVEDNYAAAWRQFSATSGTEAAAGWKSYYYDCTFQNNAEYGLYMSREMPTDVTGCTFINNGVANYGYKGVFTDCTFNNCTVNGDDQGQKTSLKSPELPPYPIPASSTGDLFETSWNSCEFTNCTWNCVWYGAAKYATFRFTDCDFIFDATGGGDNNDRFTFFGGSGGTISTVMYRMTFTGNNRLIDNGIQLGSRFLFLTADPLFELNIDSSGLTFDTTTGSGDWSNATDPLSALFQVRDPNSVDGTWNAGNPTDQPYYQDVMPVVTVGDQASLNIPSNIKIVWFQFGSDTSITYDGAITNPNP